MIAKAIANELDATFFSVKCSDILNKYVAQSSQNIKALFDSAHQYKNSIIFFDEFETIGQARGNDSNNSKQAVITELLTQIQGTDNSYQDKKKNKLLLIAATNRPWMIDSALLRPGRFGTRFKIDLPNKEARKFLIMNSLSKVKYDLALDIEKIIECTEGFNGADISDNFIETMKSHSIDRAFKLNLSEAIITNEDLDYAIEHCKSSVSKEDIERLEEFEKSLN
jgi:SpoVK/Ycf46/Vps4 family AAA+-type ATPase